MTWARVAAVGLIALASAAADARTLRIGVEGSYPPFSRVDPDGQVRGFDIDIGAALCERLKASCQWVQLPFDGMIPALQAGKIDAVVASMSITPERGKQVAFTTKYYQSPARLLVKRNTRIEATPRGLAGKRIGVQRGTTHDRYATDQFTASTVVRYNRMDDVFLDLIAGRVDAALTDAVVAGEVFLKSKRGRRFELAGTPFTDPAYFGVGAGIALRLTDTALKSELDSAIYAMRGDGTYRRIQDRYFEFDIYGAVPDEVAR